jgi:hypothetical protein
MELFLRAVVEQLYDAYTAAILGAVGKRETTIFQLDELGNALMPGFYRGAFPRGKHPGPDGRRHVLLVNGMSGPPGDHWHAIYREPGHPRMAAGLRCRLSRLAGSGWHAAQPAAGFGALRPINITSVIVLTDSRKLWWWLLV